LKNGDIQFPAGDVVKKEERTGSAGNQIVDVHGDKILPDMRKHSRGPGNFDFCAYSVATAG